VDEWGTWYDVEPGTNPGFLYQQNTMRDAIVAALNLNIFNKHSDRIAMANIAQVVNVLQAMLLTEGTQIVKTPTYEVFSLFCPHQDATLVESTIDSLTAGMDGIVIPALSESVSVKELAHAQKMLTVTLANTSLTEDIEVELQLPNGQQFDGDASIALLHAEVHSHNTFAQPENVKAVETTAHWNNQKQTLKLPACSVCRVNCYVR
jgi:alpha-N-arabinofuranosidase